jgi:hypothetical protein
VGTLKKGGTVNVDLSLTLFLLKCFSISFSRWRDPWLLHVACLREVPTTSILEFFVDGFALPITFCPNGQTMQGGRKHVRYLEHNHRSKWHLRFCFLACFELLKKVCFLFGQTYIYHRTRFGWSMIFARSLQILSQTFRYLDITISCFKSLFCLTYCSDSEQYQKLHSCPRYTCHKLNGFNGLLCMFKDWMNITNYFLEITVSGSRAQVGLWTWFSSMIFINVCVVFW